MSSLVKKALKKVFPIAFLKQAFLVYNKFRIGTIDKILFPEYRVEPDQFLRYKSGYPFRENNISLDDLPENSVKALMATWDEWTQEEFILQFRKPCWIEPRYGWAIVPPNKLLYYSIAVSRTAFQRKPDLLNLVRKKKTRHEDKIVSLRDSGEENYFHFFNDVLTKIFFLRQHGFDLGVYSILVSEKLWFKPYFQYYLTHSETLRTLKWIVQDQHTYIHCNEIIFCKPLTHRKDLLDLVRNELPVRSSNKESRKIFLTRSKRRLRFLENAQQIEAFCVKQGFEIVDTDKLTPQQQVELFSDTSFLIGIHGAGLANMIFRSGECKLLEIFPPPDLGYLPYHYIMLAKMLGFRYRAVVGSAGMKYSGGFYLDPKEFERTFIEWSGKTQ